MKYWVFSIKSYKSNEIWRLNDQYNESSNHIQMKGGGGSGRAWDPRGRGGPPLPPYPFICLWFDVSLYWSFSLRFLFVYISFYASNVYFGTYCFLGHILWPQKHSMAHPLSGTPRGNGDRVRVHNKRNVANFFKVVTRSTSESNNSFEPYTVRSE